MYLTQRQVNKRIYLLHSLFVLVLFLLASRLFYLQIIKHEDLKQRAENQQRRPIALSKKRGLITDRNGDKNVLAIDTQSISLYAYTKEYKLNKYSIEEMASKISPIINEDIEKVIKKLEIKNIIWKGPLDDSVLERIKKLDIPGIEYKFENKNIVLYTNPEEYDLKKYKISEMAEKISLAIKSDSKKIEPELRPKAFTWLKRQMDSSLLDKIKSLKLPGINYVFESKRIYPKKELASSLIGFTGIDNNGLSGIEHAFDSVLTGKTEQEKIFLDARGSEVLNQEAIDQVTTSKAKTNKVRLTLDENIQYIAERELEKGLKEYKAKRALAIVMDLENGDLLALATYPNYDINNYSEVLEKNKNNWEIIKNWAVTDVYEPGSTMKIFSIAAALEKGKVRLNEYIHCPPMIRVDGWPVTDHGSYVSKDLRPVDILKTSSNIGTSLVTRRINPTEHRDLLEKFGFGKKTDSQLSGEVDGVLPQLPWAQSRQSTISFGQGVSVTPLQIVTAMSAIVRKGIRIEPRIIKEIVGPDDEIIKEYKSKEIRTLSENTAEQIRKLLLEVVQDKEGTGKATRIAGYTIGGKTGTADKVENGRYSGNVISSFLGFFPGENPKVTAFVLYDSPKTAHYASLTAVPVFRRISEGVLKYLRIPPSRPEELLEENN